MIRTPRAHRLLYCSALATFLSAGVLALVGCVAEPVNTNARNADPNLHGSDAQHDWEKQQKEPVINEETFYAAGQMLESQELWDRAIAQYNKALKVSKDHLPSLYRLGVIYAKFKQYPQATVIWKHYLTATGGDPTAYANIGFCYELAGNFEEAQNSYESGIRRDPSNAPCRVNYGLMLARRGHFNQAMHEWQVVLPPAEVYYNLGSAYEAMDRKEQAKAEFHKALELDPQLADAKARLERLGDKVAVMPPASAVAQSPGGDAPVGPTTTPSVATSPEMSPETKPVEAVAIPTTAPATQPVVLTETPTTAPSADAGQSPSTQPTASTDAPTTAPITDSTAGDRPQVDITDPPAKD
jgi:tetratricopeptide (TPR) repeat protein